MSDAIQRALDALTELKSGGLEALLQQAKDELEAIQRDIAAAKIIRSQLDEVRARYDRGSAELAELESKIQKKSEEWGTLSGEVTQLRKRLKDAMVA